MSPSADPRCPHCGEPIGATATYCMHCSADLTAERDAADADGDGYWEQPVDGDADARTAHLDTTTRDPLLAPDGLLDDSLTVLVGIAGGLVVGIISTFVLVAVTESVWAFPTAILAWLLATAHLVRRRTVQDAIARTAYGVAAALLLVPLVAFSPGLDGSLADRTREFGVLLLLVALPALLALAVGYVVDRLARDDV